MRRVTLVLALLAFCSGATSAEATYSMDLKVGSSDLDTIFGETFRQFVSDDDDAIGVSLGYLINPRLGLELGYRQLGTFAGLGSPCSDSAEVCAAVSVPVEAEFETWTAVLVPQWTRSRLTLFAKVGAAYYEADVREVVGGGPPRAIDGFGGAEFLWGGGVRFELAERLDLVAESEAFNFDVETVSLGLGWSF